MMLTVRGTYDGKTFRVLPSEKLPRVTREVPVAIIFLEEMPEERRRQLQVEAAQWMRAIRESMPVLDVSIKDLIEEGRDH
jgi:hypothetical protein